MDSNGMYSNMGSGMLGLEMSLHHVPPQQNPNPNPNPMQHQSHPPMVSYITHDVDHRQQSQPPLRPGGGGGGGAYPSGNKPKTTPGLTLSDDDDPGGPTADQNSADDGKRKMCPWQRMKWTDNMVRLLIMVVYYIGDEVGSEGNSNDPAGNKKKAGAAAGGGVLQKKGKWKSVSRAMMERGFYVSPQQCEDKFNDLNKRYKRVNDIIGKGTACKVVENQSLLETLDLSPKMKEEAKKLLNSKHLFFREMCAYHNSCAHGGGASGSDAGDGGSDPNSQSNNHHHQQKCVHSSENARIGPNLGRAEIDEPKANDNDDDDEDSDDDEEYEEDEEDSRIGQEEDEKSRKRGRKTESWSGMMVQQLSGELRNVCEDSSRSAVEKRRWIKARAMQLEEQRVEYESEALELEKQRVKWEKFSSKKEREMEREKMMNQRKKLENDRMVLLLHQKELELMMNDNVHHQAYNRTSDPSSVTG